jgi:hypothetical protein
MAHAKAYGTRSEHPIGRSPLAGDYVAFAGANHARRGEVGLITYLARSSG